MLAKLKSTTTFVIPHQGRMPLLLETLTSIATLDNIETVDKIIIVSLDIDATGENLTNKYGLPTRLPSVTILKPTQPNTIAGMRNLGASHTQSDNIVFLDADIKLTPNWLSTMYSLARDNPNSVLYSAVQQPDTNNSMLHRIRSILSQKNTGTDLKSLPGANLFMSVKRYNESNKFDETLVSCEDVVFSTSLLEHGNLQLTDKAAFVHLGEDKDLKQLFRKEMFRGESNLFTLRLDKKLIGELPSILAPLLTTLSLLALTVLLLVGGSAWSIITTLLLCLSPVIAYSLRFKTIKTNINVSYIEVVMFYITYFLGRGVGMLFGLSKRLF